MMRSVLLICIYGSLYTNAQLLKPRIVGGTAVSITRLPYEASIRVNNAHSCGGAIITQRTILTAAHCVDRLRPAQLSVRVGSTYRTRGGTIVDVSGTRMHFLYNRRNLNGDIAMIYLSRPLQFSSRIRPIPLYGQQLRGNTRGSISGWGTQRENTGLSKRLRQAQIKVMPRSICRRVYGRVTRTQFCAGTLSGTRDTCQGDSGGPFVIRGRLAGITSSGDGCGRRGRPGIYTKIPLLRGWINNYVV